MKNSLFKRVFATVASVPFALSQCLTYTSYAVTNDSVQVETANARAGGGEVYNLEKLLYIEPGQTESTWYDTFHTELVAIGESGNNVRTISKEMLEDIILKNVGKHAGQAEEVIKMLADEGITYRISSSGDITIIAEIVRNPDFSIFTAEANARIEQALNEMKQKVEDAKAEMSEKFDIPIEEFDDFNVSKEYLAEKYGVPLEELEKYNFTKEDIAEKLDIPVEDLEDVNSVEDIEIPAFDFSEVDFTGKFELIIKGSDLEDGHTMGIQAKYTSNQPVNGKRVWSMGDLVEFADVKLEELKVCADRTIHEIPDEEAKAEAKSMVTNKFSGLEKWIDKAYNNKDKLTDRKHNITKTAGNVQQLIQQINDYIDEARATGKYSHLVERVERRLGKNANIPPTASAIFAIDPVLRIYDTIMNDLDEIAVSYNIDLPSSAIAEFADTDLRNVTATAKGDTYTLAGFFHDEELGGDNLKEMLATIELGDINTPDATLATIGLQIFRPEQTTTTTTTSTTTTSGTDSTTTTTASNGTDTTTTTTETSGTDTDTTTTTTDTTDGTDTDTTTTTETSDYTGTDTDTTTTTTDSDYTGTDTDTTTTTTDSDYTGTDTDTTTTTTDSDYTGTDTDTTTTTTDSDYTGTDTDTTTT
ncbi:MAG: hypothetical protein K2G36_04990, partial [Ruminococcus sp.]|nr:hypothetical protein [Ruminococcus sp.]